METNAVVPTIRVTDLQKDYEMGSNVVHALRGVSLTILPGEFVGVMGPSGSGKSTFMSVVGCLDQPTSGDYELDGVAVKDLNDDELATIRNRKIGFVFQGFNLLPRMSALGNVMLPMMYAGVSRSDREIQGLAALKEVGLENWATHRPNELSGGQQQRVAIARALSNGPSLILADEPTGNLDTRTSVEIMAILQRLNDAGITIIMVTHELDIARYCKRNVAFRDGEVVDDRLVADRRNAVNDLQALPVPAQKARAA